MDELIGQVSSMARGMWAHRWVGLFVAWVAAAVGACVVLLVPDRYEASARIYVNTQSILNPLMSGLAVQPNVEEQVAMLSRTLISRPNVEKLVRMADLDSTGQSKGSQDSMIDGLMKTLQIRKVGSDNLYVLSYVDRSPDQAKRVVQSLVSIFVESSLGGARKDTDAAKKFIDEQIKSYETRLEEAEARLKEFKIRNIETQAAGGADMAGQLGALSNQLSQARLELREAENSRDEAKRQLDAEKAQSATLASRSASQDSAGQYPTPEIDGRIEAQKRSLDSLLQRFTEQHPDVVGAKRLIRELEEVKRKEVQELRKAAMANPSPATSTNSLAFQELSRLLAASEVQVAALRARVGEYEARFGRARQLMKTAPQVEAEFAQLNRDYDNNKKNYNDLIARRESAAMSGELDSAAGVADFRVIDPPRASQRPVAPNRLALMPVAMLFAIGAGLAASFLGSQLRAVFQDAQSLSQIVGLPLLGVVSMVMSDTALIKERADQRRFLGASLGLLIAFGAGMIALSMVSGRAG